MTRRRYLFPFVLALGLAALAAWNYLSLQRPALATISADPRNSGISLRAHYQWLINPRVVIFDLREVPLDKSAMDVSRTLLQFSEHLKDENFDKVVLSYKGNPRFVLKGSYFRTLGEEYGVQNPIYTLRTLPENVYNLDGSPAFGTWTGGWLGVIGKQMEDLNEFHRAWYLSDIADDRQELWTPKDDGS